MYRLGKIIQNNTSHEQRMVNQTPITWVPPRLFYFEIHDRKRCEVAVRTFFFLTAAGSSHVHRRLRLRSGKQHRPVWWRHDSHFTFFLGTGCMIELQSSMSKHIPVSVRLLSAAAILLCRCVFCVYMCSFCWNISPLHAGLRVSSEEEEREKEKKRQTITGH